MDKQTQQDQFRREGSHLYEYSKQHQAYIHVYQNAWLERASEAELIAAYRAEQDGE